MLLFTLDPDHPNPFNPSTCISYTVAEPVHVTLRVFDMPGREVVTLVDRAHTPGRYEVTFDSGNLASGMYLYRMEAGGFTQVRRMVLVK